MLSQLLLQQLLLSYCMPSQEDMKEGTPDAKNFVSSLVQACDEVSMQAPRQLLFAEVQTSLVLASVLPLVSCSE
jgi:hypothetical protein